MALPKVYAKLYRHAMKREFLDLVGRTFVAAIDAFSCSLLLAVWIARRARIIEDVQRLRAWLMRALR